MKRTLRKPGFKIILLLIFFTISCSARQSAERFNRQASDPYSMPEKIIEVLKISKGQNIIDLGSGGGYYSFRFSKLVGKNGKVYAADVNEKFLEYINEQIKDKGIKNIVPFLVKENSVNLKSNTIDLIFLRNVFHHIPEPGKYFKKIKHLLKHNGRIAIIDYTNAGFTHKIFDHATSPDEAIKAMKYGGYKIVKRYSFLNDQLFIIFKINK